MKTLFNRLFTLFTTFLALFKRGSAFDAAAVTPQAPQNMLETDYLALPNYPVKKRPFNNRKRTKGRNFYYDNHGKKRMIVKADNAPERQPHRRKRILV